MLTIDECLPSVECEENANQETVREGYFGLKGSSSEMELESDSRDLLRGAKEVASSEGEEATGGMDLEKNGKASSDDRMDTQSCGDKKITCCSREDLLSLCDVRLLKRLVTCVIKTMDLAADMSDSPTLYCLPVAITWKVFYTLIAR